jgi:xanthine dehydrogenase accessory factor
MSTHPWTLLQERLGAGLVTIEAVRLDPGGTGAGTRVLLAEDGAVLHGDPAEAAAAIQEAAGRLGPGRRTTRTRGEEGDFYLERWAPAPRLVIFGGGHIGRAVAAAVRDLDFRVVVAEDRAYFADPERFEGRVECCTGPLEEASQALDLGRDDFVVIATRGHSEDLTCLRSVLPRRPFYLGLLGSRRKLREFLRVLGDEGTEPEDLERVRCPVGLDIGAETPAEIAVAVAAQLVGLRAGRPGTRQQATA